jgi:hypothetical protein
MGGLVGGGAPKPDTSALNAQIAENARLKASQETEQRKLAEEASGKRKALRGGSSGRSLLSDVRLNPEAGVEDKLGSGSTLG